MSPLIHVTKQFLFFWVSAPTVLYLDVDTVLSPRSLRNALDHYVAASREVHCIWFYHSVSLYNVYSVYNALLLLLLWLCINSWRSFQFTWNYSSLLVLWAQKHSIISIYNLFSHSPIEGHTLVFQFFATTNKAAKNIFVQVFFPYDLFGVQTQQWYGWIKRQAIF